MSPFLFYQNLRRSLVLLLLAATLCAAAQAAMIPLRYCFGPAPVSKEFIQLLPGESYGKGRNQGFEAGSEGLQLHEPKDAKGLSSLSSETSFTLSVRVPKEGNYRVTVTLGDWQAPSVTSVKAELRRLMLEAVSTAAGEFKTLSFVVNTRRPQIAAREGLAAGEVKLKAPRELTQEAWAWDDALTLEFCGTHPSLVSLEITQVEVPTVYLIGDSTVCDQSREPYASWGQMLPRFFGPDVAVANHAESGETYRDSIGRRRLDKILSLIKPGDYLFMQFGHNDQKQIAENKGGPFTTYKDEMRRHVKEARAQLAIPVIVSPMERRGFDAQGRTRSSLADYTEACRQVSREEGVPYINLNAKSKPLYEWLEARGHEQSRKAFAGQDNTHHNNYGAYELAKCIIMGVRENKLPLARLIAADFKEFDPSNPDAPEGSTVPASSQFTNQRPLGD